MVAEIVSGRGIVNQVMRSALICLRHTNFEKRKRERKEGRDGAGSEKDVGYHKRKRKKGGKSGEVNWFQEKIKEKKGRKGEEEKEAGWPEKNGKEKIRRGGKGG